VGCAAAAAVTDTTLAVGVGFSHFGVAGSRSARQPARSRLERTRQRLEWAVRRAGRLLLADNSQPGNGMSRTIAFGRAAQSVCNADHEGHFERDDSDVHRVMTHAL